MVYLDSAATTRPKFFAKDYSYNWMNSNANYALTEKQDLEDTRKRIKDCLGVKSGKIIIGGTASQLVDVLMNYL